MPSNENVKEVEKLSGLFNTFDNLYLADITGMSAEQETLFRKECREAGVSVLVAKNTLSRIAVKGTKHEMLDEYFKGPTTLAFGTESSIAPAKVLVEFRKKNKLPKLKVALVEDKVMSPEEIVRLSTIPSREQLYAQVLGVMAAPIAGLATACAGVIRNFVCVLNEHGKQKE